MNAQQGSNGKGLLAPPPLPGAQGSMSDTNSAQGTTSSIASRNSRLQVRLTVLLRPRLLCFMAVLAELQGIANTSREDSSEDPMKRWDIST